MPDFAEMLYGGAQHAAQEQGQGMAQAIGTGAELAMRKEQLDQQRQMLMQKQQELQDAKTEKYYNFQMSALKLNNASDRKNSLQMGLGLGRVLGLSDQQLNPEGVGRLASDENIQRVATLDQKVRNGEIPPADALDLMTNPLKHDKFMEIPPTPLEFINKQPDLSDAQDYVVKQAQIKAQQALENRKADVAEKKADAQMAALAAKPAAAASKEVDSVSKEYRAALAPLNKKQDELRGALDARDRVAAAQAAGKIPASQDIGAMVFPLLHSELGRVNVPELESQLHTKGLEAMTEDQLARVVGGAGKTTIKNIMARLESAASNADVSVAQKAKSFEDQIAAKGLPDETKQQILAGLKSLKAPISRPRPGAASATVTFRGRSVNRADLQKVLDANPTGPSADEARAALGGG